MLLAVSALASHIQKVVQLFACGKLFSWERDPGYQVLQSFNPIFLSSKNYCCSPYVCEDVTPNVNKSWGSIQYCRYLSIQRKKKKKKNYWMQWFSCCSQGARNCYVATRVLQTTVKLLGTALISLISSWCCLSKDLSSRKVYV